jgi:threonine aldolase
MREAMARAEVGDDVFGDDPTINRLQERCADLLGKEASLFVPSGTMANQVSFISHTHPGDEMILEAQTHPILNETGGIAANCGVQVNAIATERGHIAPEQVVAAIRSNDDHHPHTSLLSLENTHNFAGGTVYPLDMFQATCQEAHKHGLAVHLDGARLMNACIASETSPAEYGRCVDSVAMCFSKGLGAPVGSILAGSCEFIAKARRARKRLGGGMRQAGILAAAALYALDHHVERLADDHANARQLAEALSKMSCVEINLDSVETNIVIFKLQPGAMEVDHLINHLAEKGVWIIPIGPNTLRAVTHLDVDSEGIETVISAFAEALA